jgi:RecB family exonuclease
MRRERLVPEILPITASAVEAFARCPRLYHNQHLLGLPPSDEPGSPDFGSFVHGILEMVHRTGSCHDTAHVGEVLAAHGVDEADSLTSLVARHAARCPSPVSRERHELELARMHKRPPPMFMATGRLDAVWEHDGLLDVRDYKTGGRGIERLAEDPRARLQAWLAAPIAQRNGLRLRIRYEHLAGGVDEDPEPFEPDDEDLAVIEEELRTFAERVVDAAYGERGFAGVHEIAICSTCRYRSVCPDSAAPGEPSWPLPPEEDEEPS